MIKVDVHQHPWSEPLVHGRLLIGDDGVLARRPISSEEELRPHAQSRGA
jgi:hypothetical protein